MSDISKKDLGRIHKAEMSGDIQIRYFLPHTLELNPIEVQWKTVKKATANTLYENTSDMTNAIRRMMMSGETIKAKMTISSTLTTLF